MEKLRIENQELRERLSTIDAGEVSFDPRFAGPEESIDIMYQSTGSGPNTTRAFNIALKLREIFVGAYEVLLTVPTESVIIYQLGKLMAQRAGHYQANAAYSLDAPSTQKLRTQLEALGLIDIIGELGGGTGSGARRWQVTEKGKRFAHSNLAIRKLDADDSVVDLR